MWLLTLPTLRWLGWPVVAGHRLLRRPGEVRSWSQVPVRLALRVYADALVAAWRESFDAAAKTLAECLDRLGPLPLEEGTAILQKGDDAVAVWFQAQAA